MDDFFFMALAVLALLLAAGYRERILGALRRFDRKNLRRQIEQMEDQHDPTAHFRHTLRMAEEQVEKVVEITVPDERTALPVTRYLFEGEIFATRADAERARAEKIGKIARSFYADLPKALSAGNDGKLGRE